MAGYPVLFLIRRTAPAIDKAMAETVGDQFLLMGTGLGEPGYIGERGLPRRRWLLAMTGGSCGLSQVFLSSTFN